MKAALLLGTGVLLIPARPLAADCDDPTDYGRRPVTVAAGIAGPWRVLDRGGPQALVALSLSQPITVAGR